MDAIVNPTNTEMSPDGGVDRAIHDAAGPGLLEEVRSRFPTGLAVGDAGWTHGGTLGGPLCDPHRRTPSAHEQEVRGAAGIVLPQVPADR
ncbi:macro domain-containing protein [Propionibacterium freudenreichii]|uniref:macro domain-containing protein n=1 Tax=Propionibacterium freudenreichii TaxID=1744 RepID=UPI0035CF0DEA